MAAARRNGAEDKVMRTMLEWWAELDPVFAFLLMLPFIVAAAAFTGDAVRRRLRSRPSPKPAARARLKHRAWG